MEFNFFFVFFEVGSYGREAVKRAITTDVSCAGIFGGKGGLDKHNNSIRKYLDIRPGLLASGLAGKWLVCGFDGCIATTNTEKEAIDFMCTKQYRLFNS